MPSRRLDEVIREVAGVREAYKVRADLVRLGVLLPVEYTGEKLEVMSFSTWCFRRAGRHEHVCIESREYGELRGVAKSVRESGKHLPLLAYSYRLRRNRAFVEWLDELYARERVKLDQAYEVLREVVGREVSGGRVDAVIPSSPRRMRDVLVKPLERMSDGIISLLGDTIVVDSARFYRAFRAERRAQRAGAGRVLTVEELIHAYVEYLCERGWIGDWLKWGTHSVSLYDLWRSKLSHIPWESLLRSIRELAGETYGIVYTHYFIYDDVEREHSITVLVDAARARLGERLDKLIKCKTSG